MSTTKMKPKLLHRVPLVPSCTGKKEIRVVLIDPCEWVADHPRVVQIIRIINRHQHTVHHWLLKPGSEDLFAAVDHAGAAVHAAAHSMGNEDMICLY